jgi:hypothetical protein
LSGLFSKSNEVVAFSDNVTATVVVLESEHDGVERRWAAALNGGSEVDPMTVSGCTWRACPELMDRGAYLNSVASCGRGIRMCLVWQEVSLIIRDVARSVGWTRVEPLGVRDELQLQLARLCERVVGLAICGSRFAVRAVLGMRVGIRDQG